MAVMERHQPPSPHHHHHHSMGDKRRGGRRKCDEASNKLTKEEDAIARFVRFNCPTKSTMFEGNEVHYFNGNKAVDTLYESKEYGAKAKQVKFSNRSSAIAFMRTLLEKGLFFRARKLVAKRKDDKKDTKGDKDKDKEKGDVGKSPKKKTKKEEKEMEAERKEKEKRREKVKESDENEEDEEKEKKGKEKDGEDKKKRKVRLEYHQDQSFNDTNDVYVWIFDPTPLYKKVIGGLMVLGTILGCLFPLWPIWLRQGVYYLSLVGLGCFGVLIAIAIARTILFAIIWAVTMGRHKLWLLPNLTEDCGFFESFKPLYTYEYCPGGISSSTTGNKKKNTEHKNKNHDRNGTTTEDEKRTKKNGKESEKEHKSDNEKVKEAENNNGDDDESIADSDGVSLSEIDETAVSQESGQQSEEGANLEYEEGAHHNQSSNDDDDDDNVNGTSVRHRHPHGDGDDHTTTNDDFVLINGNDH